MEYWKHRYKKRRSTAEKNRIRKMPKRLKNLRTYAGGNAYHRYISKCVKFEEEQVQYETFCCTA